MVQRGGVPWGNLGRVLTSGTRPGARLGCVLRPENLPYTQLGTESHKTNNLGGLQIVDELWGGRRWDLEGDPLEIAVLATEEEQGSSI